MVNKISAIYFSPTQTTKKTVKAIADGLSENYTEYNLTMPQKREEHKALIFNILIAVKCFISMEC